MTDKRAKKKITVNQYDTLMKLEPELLVLKQDILAVKRDDNDEYFCANDHWYERFKPRLVYLVGWDAKRQGEFTVLGNSDSYDIMYDYLYSLLPDCRNCNCF